MIRQILPFKKKNLGGNPFQTRNFTRSPIFNGCRSATSKTLVQQIRILEFRTKWPQLIERLNPTQWGWKAEFNGATLKIDTSLPEGNINCSEILDAWADLSNRFPFTREPKEELEVFLRDRDVLECSPIRLIIPVSIRHNADSGLRTQIFLPHSPHDGWVWSILVGWIFSIPEFVGFDPHACSYEFEVKDTDFPPNSQEGTGKKYSLGFALDYKREPQDMDQIMRLIETLFSFYPQLQSDRAIHYLLAAEMHRRKELTLGCR